MYKNKDKEYLLEIQKYAPTLGSNIKDWDDLQRIAFSVPKKTALTNEETLFAFRCVIEDALMSYEFATPGQMAKEFGYTDVDEAVKIYNECTNTRIKLNKSEVQLRDILNKLSEAGIE